MADLKKIIEAQKRARQASSKVVSQSEAEDREYDPHRDGPRLVLADEDAIARFRSSRVCGECAHFLHRRGQEEAARQGTFKALFDREQHNHSASWYGDLTMFGLCDCYDGHMAHALAPCKVPAHFFDSSLLEPDPVTNGPKPNKDAPVDCPHYRKGDSFVRQLKVYQGGGKTYDPE